MSKKAEIKVELDTDPAKAKLREMAREGEAAAGRVSDAASGGLGRAATFGAVAGAGFGLAQRATSRLTSFASDFISEGTVGIRAGIDDFLLGPEARASATAREQTKAAFAEIIGRQQNPSVTPEIRNYYNHVRSIAEITERGNSTIDQELGSDIMQDAIERITDALGSGFQRIVDAIQASIK